MSIEEESLEERKAEVLIKLRGYKLVKKEKGKENISYLVNDPKEKKKILLWCVPKEGTVGVTSVSKLQKAMKEAEVEEGIVITGGRYTYTVKQEAKKKKVELLPKTFPVFDIFEHAIVPRHEILTEKEREELLLQFKIQPYQLPRIKASDPAVKVIGAKPGDILRIIRESPTAGEYNAYRYVVE